MDKEIEVEVPGTLDGARVDKVIAQTFGVSRAVASQIVAGGAYLDGDPVRAADRVSEGQVLRCHAPSPVEELEPEPVEFGVLYEDDHLIVVDKPAGVVVHPGSGRVRGTLAAGLLHRFPDLEGVGAPGRWGLVHRLDKDTSGVLLVARTSKDYEKLTEDLRRRRIARVYTALVEGAMPAPTGTIDAPIGRDPAHPMRRAVAHDGKHARTHYEVLHRYETSDITLLRVSLETGRTHQIRVHLSAIDHPVVGDPGYGATRKDIASPRTFLHATEIELAHPVTGEPMSVSAPLPADLERVLAALS